MPLARRKKGEKVVLPPGVTARVELSPLRVEQAGIATVAVGYADGWFRSLGNRGHGVIGGIKVPLVGRVSMDLTTFDVTDVPAPLVHPGALIDLISPEITVDEVAADAGTIGYEVLTALGRRHHRRWLSRTREGKPA